MQDGFDYGDQLCDAIFIDLPSPWLVVKHAKRVLRRNGSFVSFSPCIEQLHETRKILKENGFIQIRCFENLYRTYSFVKQSTITVPKQGVKRELLQPLEMTNKEITIASSKADMRGHTGFLLMAISI